MRHIHNKPHDPTYVRRPGGSDSGRQSADAGAGAGAGAGASGKMDKSWRWMALRFVHGMFIKPLTVKIG